MHIVHRAHTHVHTARKVRRAAAAELDYLRVCSSAACVYRTIGMCMTLTYAALVHLHTCPDPCSTLKVQQGLPACAAPQSCHRDGTAPSLLTGMVSSRGGRVAPFGVNAPRSPGPPGEWGRAALCHGAHRTVAHTELQSCNTAASARNVAARPFCHTSASSICLTREHLWGPWLKCS
jgi:hypothetical protein